MVLGWHGIGINMVWYGMVWYWFGMVLVLVLVWYGKYGIGMTWHGIYGTIWRGK